MPDAWIKEDKGETVWNGNQFEFIRGDAPASVNPSLRRQEKLNNVAGLSAGCGQRLCRDPQFKIVTP